MTISSHEFKDTNENNKQGMIKVFSGEDQFTDTPSVIEKPGQWYVPVKPGNPVKPGKEYQNQRYCKTDRDNKRNNSLHRRTNQRDRRECRTINSDEQPKGDAQRS